MRAVSTAENLLNDNEEEFNLSVSVSEDSDEADFNNDDDKIVPDPKELWINKQEEEDEKEALLYKAQNFSQALMEATFQKLMKRIERDFQTDLFSIPFIEDPDLDLQKVPKSTFLGDDKESSQDDSEKGKKIGKFNLEDFDDLKPEEPLDLGSDWANLEYDFSMLTTTQLSNKPSVSGLGSTVKRQISTFNFEKSSLKELQNFERKKTVAVQDDLAEDLKRDLFLALPFEPDLIEQERYFETRPKQESKQDGTFAGIFLNMLNKVDNAPPETQEALEIPPSRLGFEETHSKQPEAPFDESILC